MPSLPAQLVLALTIVVLTAMPSSAQLGSDIYLGESAADVTMYGAPYDRAGYGFAVGDFDGDSSHDLAVLCRGQEGATGRTLVYILWGPATFPATVDLSGYLSKSTILTASGEMGWLSRICAGDFNGDEIDDLALGIPCRYPYSNCDGKLYLIFGSQTFPQTMDLGTAVLGVSKLLGYVNRDGGLGMSLTAADLNRDGFCDVVTGAPLSVVGSEVYVVRGRSNFPAQMDLSTPLPGLTRLVDTRPYQSSGKSVACGDINSDSWTDLLIGSPGEGQDNGEATLIFGSATLPDTILLAVQPPGSKRFHGAGTNDQLGYRVAITDFDSDQFGDIVLSAYAASSNGWGACGEVDIVFGNLNLPSSVVIGTTPVETLRLIGSGELTNYGVEMGEGDLNDDGFGDVMLMSKPDLSDPTDLGRVTVVYGSYSTPDSVHLATNSLVTRIHAESREDGFGNGIFTYDLNNDGVSDMVMGAPSAAGLGRPLSGKCYVLNGSQWTTGLNADAGVPLALGHNYPNPFNPSTRIPLTLAHDSSIRVAIYDVRGIHVRTIHSGPITRGSHVLIWDGKNDSDASVSSGVYFCRAEVETHVAIRKIVLLK